MNIRITLMHVFASKLTNMFEEFLMMFTFARFTIIQNYFKFCLTISQLIA